MRRTRSKGLNPDDELLPPPAPFRPTMSGLAEAFGFDEPAPPPALTMRRTRSRGPALEMGGQAMASSALPPPPPFRSTISELEDALNHEAPPLPRGSLCRRQVPPPAAGPVGGVPFRPTISGLQEELDDAIRREALPPLPRGSPRISKREVPPPLPHVPFRPTVSGLESMLMDSELPTHSAPPPPAGLPMRRTRSQGHGGSSDWGGTHGGLPMQTSVSGILNNLLGEGADNEDLMHELFDEQALK